MTDFKRDAYYMVKNAFQQSNVVFLLGPRKCGKTYALTQLHQNSPFSKMYNFKVIPKEQHFDIISKICNDIIEGKSTTYFLDETTYLDYAENEIARIAESFTEAKANGKNPNVHITLTGSQSIALASWGRSAFGGQARFIKMDFLTYTEWLKYKERTDVTEESYLDFLHGVREFYNDFTTLEEYLNGCLDETIKSNANARNYIYGNTCDLVDVNSLKDMMYLTLFKLHDNTSSAAFFRSGGFSDKLAYIEKIISKNNPESVNIVRRRLAESLLNKYNNVKTKDIDTIKQCFSFLIRCDLIAATPVFPDFNHNVNVLTNLETDGLYNKKENLFGHVNFTIVYPLFYIEILKEILPDYDKNQLSHMVLGSIVECQMRGLLPQDGSFEYHDTEDREIDYINRNHRMAVEITISNKQTKDIHLDLIPEEEEYLKVLLSKDIFKMDGKNIVAPYYQMIYKLSELSHQPDMQRPMVNILNQLQNENTQTHTKTDITHDSP